MGATGGRLRAQVRPADPAATSAPARRAASATLPGKRALARLTAEGSAMLAAHPAIATHAGNQAVQRLNLGESEGAAYPLRHLLRGSIGA